MIKKTLVSFLYQYASWRYNKVKRIYSNPQKLQNETLKNILRKAKDTAFGKQFGFRDIKSISDYQKRLPLMRYEDAKPWIDGAISAKANYIWPGVIKYFALSSGTTTGTSKYIPVSYEMIKENKKVGFDLMAFYLVNTKDNAIFDGKILLLGGSTSLNPLGKGLFAGDMSGIMSKFVPFYMLKFYQPGRHLALIPDWEEKIKRIVERVKDERIKVVAGVPSWLMIFFKQLLYTKRKNRVCEVWPDISLLVHGGLDFSLYEKLIQDIIGKKIYYMETYLASEAFIGLQDTPFLPLNGRSDGLLLMLDYGIFYEFVKPQDITKTNPTRYTVADIETDVNYAIVVTNVSGLYSYIIGDTVKFLSKSPLRLKVTGRIEDFLSALGEHLIAEEVEYAIAQACLHTGALVNNYTVAPYFPKEGDRKPGHQWLIEFSKRPSDINEFARIIDEALCARNDDYRTHRQRDFGMSPPLIYELKEGTFYKWHKKRGQLGGQHKTPRLRNSRVLADELIRLDRQNSSSFVKIKDIPS